MKNRILQLAPLLSGSLVVVSFLAILQWWPASYWLDVRSLHVDSGPESASLSIVVDRDIKREFTATRITTIRKWENGGWAVVCNANGGGAYVPDARFPADLNLRWWTDGQCHPLLPGKFKVQTAWRIGGLGIMPDKQVSVESNVFEVTP